MTQRRAPRPVVLCVLDGWGHREETEANAIALAQTPNWDRFMATAPHGLLEASEGAVGLPAGQMGNSEVGHMTIGGGRVVLQDLPRIDAAVADGALAGNPALAAFISKLKASGGTAHLMGLVSPGGVHSHQAHIAALARIIAGAGVPVALHAFLDGRDTPPQSALGFFEEFRAATADIAGLTVATICGRYYAMDRDRRWERIEQAYRVLTEDAGEAAPDARAAVLASYAAGVSDEFVAPVTIAGHAGMADGDGICMANFRADRARQILLALLDPDFDGFARGREIRFAAALGMVEYGTALNDLLAAMSPPKRLDDTLGAVVAKAGLRQLRIAETEKYAHVTFFLDGGEDREFAGEARILVPSPKVATYDLQPEMSAREITDRLVAAIESGDFDLIVVNYANADMVGHTGDIAAAIRAVAAVDDCLGRLATAVAAAGGALLITADHGNAEQMRDPETRAPHTAHSRNPVPVVLAAGGDGVSGLGNGCLADVAPTVLALMELAQPKAMTGTSLLVAKGAKPRQGRSQALA